MWFDNSAFKINMSSVFQFKNNNITVFIWDIRDPIQKGYVTKDESYPNKAFTFRNSILTLLDYIE